MYKSKGKDGKQIEKGVAFPVCVSVNDCICHCSPMESDEVVRDYKSFQWLPPTLSLGSSTRCQ